MDSLLIFSLGAIVSAFVGVMSGAFRSSKELLLHRRDRELSRLDKAFDGFEEAVVSLEEMRGLLDVEFRTQVSCNSEEFKRFYQKFRRDLRISIGLFVTTGNGSIAEDIRKFANFWEDYLRTVNGLPNNYDEDKYKTLFAEHTQNVNGKADEVRFNIAKAFERSETLQMSWIAKIFGRWN